MFEDALRYAFEDDDALTTIAIGGLLGLFGFLLVPAILVLGYLVRVVRDVHADETAPPPAFEDWEELLVDGLKALLVTLAYTLVPALLLTIAVAPVVLIAGVSVDGSGGGPTIVGTVILLLVLAIGLVGLLLLLAAIYLVPTALATFASTGRLGAAFSPGELRAVGTSGTFVTGWLVALAITLLAGFLEGVLAATVVGLLAVPFLNFYANVAAAYALGVGLPDERPADEATGN
jgi:hypothetical protein